MSDIPLTLAELVSQLNWSAAEQFSAITGCNYLLIDLRNDYDILLPPNRPNCPVIGIGDINQLPPAAVTLMDVVVTEPQKLDNVITGISRSPIAAAAATHLSRHNENVSIEDGLLAESLSYSTLQHGKDFETWLSSRGSDHSSDTAAGLTVDREDDVMTLCFDRPAKHNAYSAAMRDALCEALQAVLLDEQIRKVIVKGNGPSFCSGGDLDEFGLARDAAEAHLTRMTRSAARLIWQCKDRIEFHLHGACIGAGIELAAFSDAVIAAPGSFFQLPEVAFGLVPGAGGTVSLVRRIGRLHFNQLALSGERLDLATAQSWGLIDSIAQ